MLDPPQKVLKKDGVVRIDGVLSKESCAELRDWVLKEADLRRAEVDAGDASISDHFSDVLLRKNRCDLRLAFTPLVKSCVVSITDPFTDLGYLLQKTLGPTSLLQELASMISYPSSSRQTAHPDTPYNKDIPLLTVFVALQDVDISMGPTTFLPGTNTNAKHSKFQSDHDTFLKNSQSVCAELKAGDCSCFDSRTIHLGGANVSELTRAMFYVSFKNPEFVAVGNPPSIKPELEGKLTLEDCSSL